MPDGEMSPEEEALYLDVIRSAYPAPKTDIRAAVMAKIAYEKNNAKIMPGILSASAKKSKFTKNFVKWGSLAACAAIVCLAGVRILPALTAETENTANSDTADFEYFSAAENGSATEAAAGTSAAPESPDAQVEVKLRQYAAATSNYFSVSEDCDDVPAEDITEAVTEDPAQAEKKNAPVMYSVMCDSYPDSPADGLANEAEEAAEEAEVIENTAEEPAAEYVDITAMFESELKEKLIDVSGMKLDITLSTAELIDEIGITQQEFDEIYDAVTEKYRADYPGVMLPVYLITEEN